MICKVLQSTDNSETRPWRETVNEKLRPDCLERRLRQEQMIEGQEQMTKCLEGQTESLIVLQSEHIRAPSPPAANTERCAMPSPNSSKTFLSCSHSVTVHLTLYP
ncbi:hypothetical protein KIL84_019502 [Mauremys mutica]|uniref:Uncharacterized protein n=1 Tax=Mauremys mutica TaxID=74926 RepID=A0A9D3XV64_9SAUR|nr:hypothetical protein KIL84_019502 [Mauremys mutica]